MEKKYDEAELTEAFNTSVRLDFLNWDTAAVYGMGSCEKLLGRLISGKDDIFISTKYFPNKKFKSGALESSFNESMERLGRCSADLFWIHKPNNLSKKLKEAIPLIKDGRIKSIGISNVSIGIIILGLIIVLLIIRCVGKLYYNRTPEGGINETMYVDINDTKQWISIYGQDKDNPVLLYLHGGTCSPTVALDWSIFRKLSADYTIVEWDQRGCGHNYPDYKETEPKLSFVSVMNVPNNCTLVKGDLVATSDSYIGENVTAENAAYVKLSARATASTKNLKYTWTKSNVTAPWYVRGYLVYKDSSGAVHTVYSDCVKADLSGIITKYQNGSCT